MGVRLRMTDAAGRLWSFVDKAPVFDLADDLEMASAAPAVIRCRVVRTVRDNESSVASAWYGLACPQQCEQLILWRPSGHQSW